MAKQGKQRSLPLGQGVDLDVGLAVLIALGAAAAYWAEANGSTFAKSKPYKDFGAFYPFYLTQHQDQTCRRLHFVGTSIVIPILAMD